MAHRSGGRGTFRLDRKFPGVGRIVRATGTNRVRVFDAINQMVSTFFELGRLDVLRQLQAGALHPMEAFHEWRETGTVARRVASGPAVEAMVTWVEAARIGPDARYGYRAQVRRLAREHPRAPVTALPDLLRAYRLTLPARSFGVLRTATLAFLRDTLGRRSEVYGAVQDILPVTVVPQPQHPFTVAEMADLALADPYRAMAWTLYTTGMNPKEYFSGQWEVVAIGSGELLAAGRRRRAQVEGPDVSRQVAPTAIRIHGTKRAGRERIVPLLVVPVLPVVTARWFRPRLKRAAPGHVLYDLRRGYGHLLEAAGIPGSRIRAYLGHGARTVTDLYLRHEVMPHLAEDAMTVRALLPREILKARLA